MGNSVPHQHGEDAQGAKDETDDQQGVEGQRSGFDRREEQKVEFQRDGLRERTLVLHEEHHDQEKQNDQQQHFDVTHRPLLMRVGPGATGRKGV